MGVETITRQGMSIGDFVKLCTDLSVDEFKKQHGDFFLLQRADFLQEERPKWDRFATTAMSKETLQELTGRPKDEHLIYGVPDKGTAPFHDWVTIGRANTNLIVVSDDSISKMHAFFLRDGDGKHWFYDARSRNGSAVNGKDAPRYGTAEKLPVEPGDRVRVGSANFLFLSAEALLKLLNR
jgi:hypothetical protein